MTTTPTLDLALLRRVANLSEFARSIVFADLTVWLAEHGAVTVAELERFIDEALAVSA